MSLQNAVKLKSVLKDWPLDWSVIYAQCYQVDVSNLTDGLLFENRFSSFSGLTRMYILQLTQKWSQQCFLWMFESLHHPKLESWDCICLTSVTRAKPKEKMEFAPLISTLCVNCKFTSECYSRIFQIYWLINHLDVHLVWTTSETSQN